MNIGSTENLFQIQEIGGGLLLRGAHLVTNTQKQLPLFLRPAMSTATAVAATAAAVFAHFVSFPLQSLNQRNK